MVHMQVLMAELEPHARMLIDSYASLTGKSLLGEGIQAISATEALFDASFALLSHGTEADPILNFGNRQALALWEMDWPTFTSMPSRLTAEPAQRAGREKLLADVKRQGYSDCYRGIRIASSGQRFEIIDAVVWSVFDSEGVYRGQAAMIPSWRFVGK